MRKGTATATMYRREGFEPWEQASAPKQVECETDGYSANFTLKSGEVVTCKIPLIDRVHKRVPRNLTWKYDDGRKIIFTKMRFS